jgi:SAM-dependent methyltransferase
MFREFKNLLLKVRLFLLSVIKNPQSLVSFIKNTRNEDIYENKIHIELATKWLLKSQKVGCDNGYSRGFYLYKNGWDKSYIETTGYIIPTLLDVYQLTNNKIYRDSALKAGEWLLLVQKNSGAFTDIDNNIELVFDTGQVLYGLISIYKLENIDEKLKQKYKKAILKASNWLCKVQDNDGSWTQYGYNQMGHSYYSRVSSQLYEAGILFNNKEFIDCAKQHIAWVLDCQMKNGFFKKLKFSNNEENLLHTIVYVLEGLYDYYILTKDQKVLSSLLRNAQRFKEINISRDLLLCSQYDQNFNCANNERCMTGLAQWASISFKLYRLTNEEDYLLVARKTLYYLKSKQFKDNDNLKGSLPGSIPFWGIYAPYSAINWGVKFFIDALIENEQYQLSLIEDSNLWIGECFKFENHVVDDSFTQTSKEYLKVLERYIDKSNNILDLGCGEGKYIRYFQNTFSNKNIKGIDPYFYDNDIVKKGDVYNINFDKKFDLIYTIEVLQHVKYLNIALKEIYKHLSDDGVFIICDRNPNSFIGYVKSIQEYRGRWMYPFDSPFVEKWYSLSKWKSILIQNGFIIDTIKTFNSKNGKLGWMNKYNIIIVRKKNR